MARDMTQKQFENVLQARGWKLVLGMFVEMPGGAAGAIYDRKRGKLVLNRRATLAEAIKFANRIDRSNP